MAKYYETLRFYSWSFEIVENILDVSQRSECVSELAFSQVFFIKWLKDGYSSTTSIFAVWKSLSFLHNPVKFRSKYHFYF